MISAVVEGLSDRGVAVAVIRAAGREPGPVHVANGKPNLDRRIANYLQAAVHSSWVVFRDSDSTCPLTLRNGLLPSAVTVPETFQLRIAHSMSEAWLLSDQLNFARYFRVRQSAVAKHPESLQNAKQHLLSVCARSRSKDVQKDMVVGGTKTGPLYVSRINEFAEFHWDVHAAASKSDSLERAVRRISAMP